MGVLTEVYGFYRRYAGEKGIYGYSERGEPLVYLKAGAGSPVLLAQYAMHAREHITARLAVEQMKDLSRAAFKGTVLVLPLVNPDGVKICEEKFPLWKANAEGVDLNVNFPARWGTGVGNMRAAGAADYIGAYPLCAAESAALAAFTLRAMPDMTVSYHAKGEEIYWYFYQKEPDLSRDGALAEIAAKVTGYALRTPQGSVGGYKDWCVETLGIPAITVEVGGDELSHPVGAEHLASVYEKNKNLLPALLNALGKGRDEG